MSRDRNFLVAALSHRTGMITPAQFAETVRMCEEGGDKPLEDTLVERGWIQPADRLQLLYLLERSLRPHGADAQSILMQQMSRVATPSPAAVAGLNSDSPTAGPRLDPAGPQPRATEGAPPVGTRYALTRLHATGGMGRVWLAHDISLRRDVALKDLRPEAAGDRRLMARFVREARLTGQLQHPGIVPVYELVSHADSDAPCYAMRFVRGRTLTSAIEVYHAKRRAGVAEPLELVALLTAFAAVCHTVAYPFPWRPASRHQRRQRDARRLRRGHGPRLGAGQGRRSPRLGRG